MKRILRFISIVCIFLFVVQTSYNTIVWIQFKFQQKYIAKELCLQRNKMNNTCKGACYLKAQLSKELGHAITYVKDKVDLFYTCTVDTVIPSFIFNSIKYTDFLIPIPIDAALDFFQPPS